MTAIVAPAAQGTPIPRGRGRWRLMAYARQWDNSLPTALAALDDARSRRLDCKLNTAAELTFTIDGRAPSAATIVELATDVVAYRWDEATARDVPMFRGIVDHSQDVISEQAHTVNFVAHDYFAMTARRFFTGNVTGGYTNMDQDTMVANLISYAEYVPTSNNNLGYFLPGSNLPLLTSLFNPDGTPRSTYSGQIRDRTWAPQTTFADAITNLAACQNGFDFDVRPNGPSVANDSVRVFYPRQGIARTDVALVYGVNVSGVSRTVSSADYANYVRTIGNKTSTVADAPQLFGEVWNTDSNNVTVNPVGLWMMGDNASDVSLQATLNQQTQGRLADLGLLTPSYSLTLRPDAYYLGAVNMGDTVQLVIRSGRLNVNTTVRVVGMTYTIGDDGNEDVALTVGRPPPSLENVLGQTSRDIDALARR